MKVLPLHYALYRPPRYVYLHSAEVSFPHMRVCVLSRDITISIPSRAGSIYRVCPSYQYTQLSLISARASHNTISRLILVRGCVAQYTPREYISNIHRFASSTFTVHEIYLLPTTYIRERASPAIAISARRGVSSSLYTTSMIFT